MKANNTASNSKRPVNFLSGADIHTRHLPSDCPFITVVLVLAVADHHQAAFIVNIKLVQIRGDTRTRARPGRSAHYHNNDIVLPPLERVY